MHVLRANLRLCTLMITLREAAVGIFKTAGILEEPPLFCILILGIATASRR
jgi:hypothetical protein